MTFSAPKTGAAPTRTVPYTIMRGGTSKALFFMKDDLPSNPSTRDALLLTILGLPELLEEYGMGKDSLSSKIAIISPSAGPDADVDYFFAQGDLRQGRVDTGVSCGNILSAVGPFALESGLVKPSGPETTVRVLSVNTQVRSHVIVRTPEGCVRYDGDTAIDGVPGAAAPVLINFLNPEGSSTGRVLPTGRPSDRVEGVEVSCVDAAMPLVIACAADFGKTGYETPDELNADSALLARLETVRREAGRLMGFGDVSKRVLPRFDLVAPPRHGGVICSRYFTQSAAHTSHAVTGALCLAAACLIPGTVAARVARPLPENANRVVIEHPAGSLATEITLRMEGDAITIPTAAFVRTAARLGRGMYHAS